MTHCAGAARCNANILCCGVALTFFPGVKNVPVDVSAHAQ